MSKTLSAWSLWVALCAFLFVAEAERQQTIWLVAIQPFTGGDWDAGVSMRAGAEIMLEQVNQMPDLLPGYQLKVVWQDGLCSAVRGANIFLDNILLNKYHAFAPGKTLNER